MNLLVIKVLGHISKTHSVHIRNALNTQMKQAEDDDKTP